MSAFRLLRRLFGQHGRTFREMAVEYRRILESRPIKKKTAQNAISALKRLEAEFGGLLLGEIRATHIARLIKQVSVAEGKLVKSQQILQVARDVYVEAILLGWADANPAQHVKRLPAPVRRQRLTLDQWMQVHEYSRTHLPPWVSRALVLALVTGQRRDDVRHFRFADIEGDHLHIEQRKTGNRIALPLDLRLDAIDVSLREAVEDCRNYAPPGPYMLRFGKAARQCSAASLSHRFQHAREGVGIAAEPGRLPPTFHEIRSLSERLYRAQGVDTQSLLGHKRQSMTDVYNDDRGLTKNDYKRLVL